MSSNLSAIVFPIEEVAQKARLPAFADTIDSRLLASLQVWSPRLADRMSLARTEGHWGLQIDLDGLPVDAPWRTPSGVILEVIDADGGRTLVQNIAVRPSAEPSIGQALTLVQARKLEATAQPGDTLSLVVATHLRPARLVAERFHYRILDIALKRRLASHQLGELMRETAGAALNDALPWSPLPESSLAALLKRGINLAAVEWDGARLAIESTFLQRSYRRDQPRSPDPSFDMRPRGSDEPWVATGEEDEPSVLHPDMLHVEYGALLTLEQPGRIQRMWVGRDSRWFGAQPALYRSCVPEQAWRPRLQAALLEVLVMMLCHGADIDEYWALLEAALVDTPTPSRLTPAELSHVGGDDMRAYTVTAIADGPQAALVPAPDGHKSACLGPWTLRVREHGTGRLLRCTTLHRRGEADRVSHGAWSADGHTLLTMSASGAVHWLRLEQGATRTRVMQITSRPPPAHARLAVSAAGKRGALAWTERSAPNVHLFDDSQCLHRTHSEHAFGPLRGLWFAPGESERLIVLLGTQLVVWSLASDEFMAIRDDVLAFDPTGPEAWILADAKPEPERHTLCDDVRKTKVIRLDERYQPSGPARPCGITTEDDQPLRASRDDALKIRSKTQQVLFRQLHSAAGEPAVVGHYANTSCCRHRLVISAAASLRPLADVVSDGRCALDLWTGDTLFSFEDHPYRGIQRVGDSSSRMLVWDCDHGAAVLDFTTGSKRELVGATERHAAEWKVSRDGSVAVMTAFDGWLGMWDCTTGQPLASWSIYEDFFDAHFSASPTFVMDRSGTSLLGGLRDAMLLRTARSQAQREEGISCFPEPAIRDIQRIFIRREPVAGAEWVSEWVDEHLQENPELDPNDWRSWSVLWLEELRSELGRNMWGHEENTPLPSCRVEPGGGALLYIDVHGDGALKRLRPEKMGEDQTVMALVHGCAAAISDDATRVAVLHNGRLEIYCLKRERVITAYTIAENTRWELDHPALDYEARRPSAAALRFTRSGKHVLVRGGAGPYTISIYPIDEAGSAAAQGPLWTAVLNPREWERGTFGVRRLNIARFDASQDGEWLWFEGHHQVIGWRWDGQQLQRHTHYYAGAERQWAWWHAERGIAMSSGLRRTHQVMRNEVCAMDAAWSSFEMTFEDAAARSSRLP